MKKIIVHSINVKKFYWVYAHTKNDDTDSEKTKMGISLEMFTGKNPDIILFSKKDDGGALS